MEVLRSIVALKVGFWLVACSPCWSYSAEAVESQEITRLLEIKMNAVREGRPDRTSDGNIVAANGANLLPHLEPYRHDVSERVRWKAYAMLASLGKDSESPAVRGTVVDRLVEGLHDNEPLVWQAAAGWFLHSSFVARDFSETAKDRLRKLLASEVKRPGFPKHQVILVVGIADMKSQLPLLEKLVVDEEPEERASGRRYGTVSWAALRARARMGVEHDIKRCIEVVESETDDVMRVTRLLPELAYVRAPRVIAHLRRYLDSERGLPPVRGRGKGVAYAQRAAALLAKVLPDFPVKQYVGGYSEEDIEACRKWMAVWEQRRTVPPKTPAESKPSSRVSADEVPKDANLAISGESEGAASVNAQPWLTSAPVEHTTEARTIERASSNAVAFVASPQEQQARLLAGSRKWAYVCVGVAASLAVGAAGAWRLLRRRSGA